MPIHSDFINQVYEQVPLADQTDSMDSLCPSLGAFEAQEFFKGIDFNDGTSSPIAHGNSLPKCFLAHPLEMDPHVAETVRAENVLLQAIIFHMEGLGLNRPSVTRSQWPNAPTMEDAQLALTRFEYRHAHFGVLCINLFPKSLNDLYLAQNELSIPWIGSVAKSHGGCFTNLINRSELKLILRHGIYLANFAPEKELVFSAEVFLLPDRHEQCLRLHMSIENNGILVIGGEV